MKLLLCVLKIDYGFNASKVSSVESRDSLGTNSISLESGTSSMGGMNSNHALIAENRCLSHLILFLNRFHERMDQVDEFLRRISDAAKIVDALNQLISTKFQPEFGKFGKFYSKFTKFNWKLMKNFVEIGTSVKNSILEHQKATISALGENSSCIKNQLAMLDVLGLDHNEETLSFFLYLRNLLMSKASQNLGEKEGLLLTYLLSLPWLKVRFESIFGHIKDLE